MYAIFKTGGKQYKARRGDILRIEKLDVKQGASIKIPDVLFIGGDTPVVGTPLIDGAVITAKVVKQTRNNKILIFKKKRRNNYRCKNGHRQPVSIIKITGIKIIKDSNNGT